MAEKMSSRLMVPWAARVEYAEGAMEARTALRAALAKLVPRETARLTESWVVLEHVAREVELMAAK